MWSSRAMGAEFVSTSYRSVPLTMAQRRRLSVGSLVASPERAYSLAVMTGRACFTLIVMTRFALRASLTCAVQFHGAGISQELSRASESDFIKVHLRKTSPPGACFRRGRTGGLLCANDSNEVQIHRGVVSVGEPALTHQRLRLLTFTSALVRAISVSASVSTSAPFNVDGNEIPAIS